MEQRKMSKGAKLISDLISAMVTASKEAGEIIREVKFSGDLEIKEKSAKTDYVTKADLEAQKCIVYHLKKRFKDVRCRGEEGASDITNYIHKLDPKPDEYVDDILKPKLKNLKNGFDFDDAEEKDLFVWIDPLDGTREYVMTDEEMNKEVTVLIGIVFRGRPIAGIVNQPFYRKTKTTYEEGIVWAIVGLGVFHNRYNQPDRRKYVEYFKPSTDHSSKRKIVTSRAHATDIINESLNNIPNSEIVYRGGCGYKVLVLLDNEANCYLYPSRGLKKWDTCAPEAVVLALDGKCTNAFNELYDYSNTDEKSQENLLGFVACLSIEEHDFYIKNIDKRMLDHIKAEAAKPPREKKKKEEKKEKE